MKLIKILTTSLIALVIAGCSDSHSVAYCHSLGYKGVVSSNSMSSSPQYCSNGDRLPSGAFITDDGDKYDDLVMYKYYEIVEVNTTEVKNGTNERTKLRPY